MDTASEKFVRSKTQGRTSGGLAKILMAQMEKNPCYFEERWASGCISQADRVTLLAGGVTPTGAFKREHSDISVDCKPLMTNFELCQNFWWVFYCTYKHIRVFIGICSHTFNHPVVPTRTKKIN